MHYYDTLQYMHSPLAHFLGGRRAASGSSLSSIDVYDLLVLLPVRAVATACSSTLQESACSASLRHGLLWQSVFKWPRIHRLFLARVNATFILRTSARNPIPEPWSAIELPCFGALTQENITTSASRP